MNFKSLIDRSRQSLLGDINPLFYNAKWMTKAKCIEPIQGGISSTSDSPELIDDIYVRKNEVQSLNSRVAVWTRFWKVVKIQIPVLNTVV